MLNCRADVLGTPSSRRTPEPLTFTCVTNAYAMSHFNIEYSVRRLHDRESIRRVGETLLRSVESSANVCLMYLEQSSERGADLLSSL